MRYLSIAMSEWLILSGFTTFGAGRPVEFGAGPVGLSGSIY